MCLAVNQEDKLLNLYFIFNLFTRRFKDEKKNDIEGEI